MRSTGSFATAIPLLVGLVLAAAPASAGQLDFVACPRSEVVAAIGADLRARPLAGDFAVVEAGCIRSSGGQYWFRLRQPQGRQTYIFLARPDALDTVYARTPSFGLYYDPVEGKRPPMGSEVEPLMADLVARVQRLDPGGAVLFPGGPEVVSAEPTMGRGCPADPTVEAIAVALGASDLPGGFRLDDRGCAVADGGYWWFRLSRGEASFALRLAPLSDLAAYARSASFSIHYGDLRGDPAEEAVSLAMVEVVRRIRERDPGSGVRFPSIPERGARIRGDAEQVECPDAPFLSDLVRDLLADPLPGGFRLVRHGCTATGGGRYYFVLASPNAALTAYLVHPDRAGAAAPAGLGLRTPSFVIRNALLTPHPDEDRVRAALAAFTERVRKLDPGGDVPFPEPGSGAAPTGSWALFLGLLGLLSLAALLGSRHGTRLPYWICLPLALFVAVFGGSTWTDPAWVWLWLLPALAAAYVLADLRRLPGRWLAEAGLLFAIALLVRWAVPEVPPNQHSSFFGPGDALIAPHARRDEGIFLLYRALGGLVPLSAGAVFAIERLVAALGISVLFLALRHRWSRAGSERPWTRVGVLLFGLFFAVDPLQARLQASDIPHVWAQLCFALSAWLYVRMVDAERDPASRGRPRRIVDGVLLFAMAMMPGLVREEQVLMALVLPVLFGPWKGLRRRASLLGPRGANLLILLGVAAAFGQNMLYPSGARPEGFTWERVSCFADGLAGLFTVGGHCDPMTMAAFGCDGFGSMLVPQDLVFLVAFAVILGLLLRRLRPALVLGAFLCTFALRIPTGWCNLPLAQDFADARYDIHVTMGLLLLGAEGLGMLGTGVWRWIHRRTPGRRWLPAAGAAAAVGLLLAGLRLLSAPYRPPYDLMMAWQREYAFLRDHLHEVKPGCEVIVVGQTGYPWFDDVLAYPHATLAFSHRKVLWRVVTYHDPEPEPAEGVCTYFYQGAMCSLGVDVPGEQDPFNPEAVRRSRAICDHLRARTVEVVAEDVGPGIPIQRPFEDGLLRLGLYRIR